MSNDINGLDTEDIGLKEIFGSRFHDETGKIPLAEGKRREGTGKPMVENKQKEKAADANWEPVKPEPNAMDRLRDSALNGLLYSGLTLVFFAFQQTGNMTPKAALPCMMVCAAMFGISIGRNVRGK